MPRAEANAFDGQHWFSKQTFFFGGGGNLATDQQRVTATSSSREHFKPVSADLFSAQVKYISVRNRKLYKVFKITQVIFPKGNDFEIRVGNGEARTSEGRLFKLGGSQFCNEQNAFTKAVAFSSCRLLLLRHGLCFKITKVEETANR